MPDRSVQSTAGVWIHECCMFDGKAYAGESVTKGKPEPDIYLLAASTFKNNPDPAKCLVFEDAPVGITSGTRAGM